MTEEQPQYFALVGFDMAGEKIFESSKAEVKSLDHTMPDDFVVEDGVIKRTTETWEMVVALHPDEAGNFFTRFV